MDSLAPPKLPHQETPGSPSFPVTVETPSPYEYPVDLSEPPTPSSSQPLEPMDAFELFWLSENIDDINQIVELLEPNPLMLRTWSYFGHCQRTARELEKEVQYQKNSAESLLMELRHLGIDEVLRPVIAEARRLNQRATRFAHTPSSTSGPVERLVIRLPTRAPTLPTPTLPTDSPTNYSTEADTGGPSRPIVIVDDDTTTPPTTSTSSSGPPFKKRRGTPRRTSSYVRRKRQATPNLGSSGLERG